MGHYRVDEIEYQRRLKQLMSHWGVSETAILMYARSNNVDIAQVSWDKGFEILTRREITVSDVQTRQVGRGYLGAERVPGEINAPSVNVRKVLVMGPVEPNALQLQVWNWRLSLEAFLSRIVGRDIKITII
ncbi:unannotated protein [freshwater metagenome]|uniref:Unannotated protein n=1 Tax=freshwater metagenome TaxID=449393 RepID=A0A6J6L5W6_9ZZZZ